MRSFKNILQNIEKVYCVGTRGTERYDLFRGILDQTFKKNIPEGIFSSNIEYTVILFPDEQSHAYYEDCKGDIFPLQHHTPDKSIRVLYLPLAYKNILNRYVYIIPPAIEIKDGFNGIEKKINLAASFRFNNSDKIVWFDSFPYAQTDELSFITQIKKSNVIRTIEIDIVICLLKGSRRYGSTDIVGEENALKAAKETYIECGFGESIGIVDISLISSDTLDLFEYKKLYKDKVKDLVEREINTLYRNFIKYYEEDFKYIIGEQITVQGLDDICSYKNWINYHENKILNCWIHYLSIEAKKWRNIVYGFIYSNYLKYITINNEQQREVDEFIAKEWNLLKNKLFSQCPTERFVKKEADYLEYMSNVKELKIIFKEAVYEFVNTCLKNDIKVLIEKNFSIWSGLIDLPKTKM